MTSFRAEDEVKRALDLKKESNTKIINKAVKLYLNEFGLDEKISELDFEIERMKKRKEEFKKIRENLNEQEEQERRELEDRDVVEELLKEIMIDPEEKPEYEKKEKLKEFLKNESGLKHHADSLGVSKDCLIEQINGRLDNGS